MKRKFAELSKNRGFTNGEFQTLLIDVPQIETAVADNRVAGVSLTGSTNAGKSIGALAGKYVKRCVLELGGSDPFIVLHDADIKLVKLQFHSKQAAKLAAAARVSNTGQVCIAAKRFIINEKVYDKFLSALTEELKKNYTIGDPMNPKVNVGPMARPDLLEELKKQLRKTVEMGAKVVYGDKAEIYRPTDPSKGNFFSPMIFEDVPKESPGFREEIFGPAFMTFKFKTEQEALAIANDTCYGLGQSFRQYTIQGIDNQQRYEACSRVGKGNRLWVSVHQRVHEN
eukprot:TRINITY_DN105307_c0_g1_i1.p2 TRINITY_DN105307_c0_g1~~TRINITY_DN105307_c0_g1_i1.p2  ORF type:complete len:284 (-),score=24.83 TRINITY_DN105307_c0_g1_i1:943-1794(-)